MFAHLTAWILLCTFAAATIVRAEEKAPEAPSADSEKVDVDAIKEKYWAKGSEAELRVVQNRAFSKAHRVELGLFGGAVSTDPFLNVLMVGGTAAYYFSEFFAVRFLGYKDFVSNSSALDTFQQTQHQTTESNYPRSFFGGELDFSPIYGKLSVFGKAIIYFDTRIALGGGAAFTDSGTYGAPMIGVGEQVFLTKTFSIHFDYRLIYYQETILEKVNPTTMGQPIGTRSNFSGVFLAGLAIMI